MSISRSIIVYIKCITQVREHFIDNFFNFFINFYQIILSFNEPLKKMKIVL